MKVLIINGSPKGKYSITLHTCLFLKEVFKEHEFEILNVGQQIKRFEIDMKDAIDAINRNDLIVFSYPVYTFVAPSQLHRFINLLKEQNIDLSSKFATQISTSKHFYDVTAHKYIEENGYELDITDDRNHHEIYLSDPRKCDVSKLKTVIRHPIKKIK